MSFQDFNQQFRALNVCKVGDWEEVRVKGEFTTRLSTYDSSIKSRYFYELSVQSKQRLLIGVHQEDERIQEVINRKPYLSLGIAILKKTPKGDLELVFMKEFAAERQVELDVDLDPGEYVILPRTSGCNLRKPKNFSSANIKMVNDSGDLHPLVELIIKDIFRRLDKYMINNIVEFGEF